ncbi:MAG: two-component regulator propeller domain-containing protein, partial [Bacteroidota bacterium]
YNLGADDGLPSDDIYCITRGPEGTIWAGSDRGLSRCWLEGRKKRIKSWSQKDGLVDEIIYTMAWGEQDQLWIGTYERGLVAFDFSAESFSSLPSKAISAILFCKPSSRGVWYITERDGLWLWDGHLHQPYVLQNGASGGALWLDQSNHLWSGSRQGKIGLSPIFIERHPSIRKEVLALCPGQDKDFWAVTEDSLFQLSSKRKMQQGIGLPVGIKPAALSYLQGEVWMGTLGQGLWHYQPQRQSWQDVTPSFNGPFPPVLSLAAEGDMLWLATLGGAYRYQASTQVLEHATTRQAASLGINYIYQIVKDQSGRLWLATDGSGVGIWDGELELLPGLEGQTILHIFSYPNGDMGMVNEQGKLYRHRNNQVIEEDQSQLAGLELRSVVALNDSLLCLARDDGYYFWKAGFSSPSPIFTEHELPLPASNANLTLRTPNEQVYLGSMAGLVQWIAPSWPQDLSPKPRLIQVSHNFVAVDSSAQLQGQTY